MILRLDWFCGVAWNGDLDQNLKFRENKNLKNLLKFLEHSTQKLNAWFIISVVASTDYFFTFYILYFPLNLNLPNPNRINKRSLPSDRKISIRTLELFWSDKFRFDDQFRRFEIEWKFHMKKKF